ncbi:MAG: DUF2207 family protein [Clostridia bacterium]
MKRKIIITFFIAILIFSLYYSKVFAETNIKETISARFPNYDVTAEYKVEVTDNTDKKIIVKFQDMTIIESYAENSNGKLDLKSLSRISYSEPNDTYFLYIEYLTDRAYLLDYTQQYKYSIYVNDKLKKEIKTANSYIDKTKGNAKNIYCTFNIEYDKIADTSSQVYEFGEKVYIVTYILFLILCVYMNYYGIRHIQSKKYGGIVNEKKIDYCRELPKWIDLETAYASLYYCSKISTKKLKNGIIGAFLLKWSNDNNILITDKGNRVFSIDLKSGDFEKTELEQELYDLLKIAAGSNNIIDNKELKIWSRSHKSVLEIWHKKLLSSAFNDNLKSEAEALLGLKKFLLDYSLIDERRHIEVKLWEHYLIYAQLLGISDEVNKQFSKIYPDYSKIGELSVMNLNELVVEYIFIKIFLLIPMALATFVTIMISMVYYIIHLL